MPLGDKCLRPERAALSMLAAGALEAFGRTPCPAAQVLSAIASTFKALVVASATRRGSLGCDGTPGQTC